MNERKPFVQQWIENADTKDSFFKFFSYYLAFLHIVDCEKKDQKREFNFFRKLIEFLDEVYFIDEHTYNFKDYYLKLREEALVKSEDFNLLITVDTNNSTFRNDWWELLKERTNIISRKCLNIYEQHYMNKSNEEQIKAMTAIAIIKIHQVRDNLFHGVKYYDSERDRQLVEASCNLLYTFLSACLNNSIGLDY